jgi:hypothetical protein
MNKEQQEKFDFYRSQFSKDVSDTDIKRKIFFSEKYPPEKVKKGFFKKTNDLQELISNYNSVITSGRTFPILPISIMQQLEINRDALINHLITEFLSMGVPVDLLPNKEELKK